MGAAVDTTGDNVVSETEAMVALVLEEAKTSWLAEACFNEILPVLGS